MKQTVESLKVILADTFTMALNAQNFHWNVEGRDFQQLHNLFGSIYEDLFGSVDTIAEHIRACDAYAPGSYTRFKELTSVQEELKIPSASGMVMKLLAANDVVIRSLRAGVEAAKTENLEEIVNFLGGRLEAHTKHGWMLKATSKMDRE